MGFNLNKAREKKEEIIKSFTPLDLNEGNVQAIFNRCMAKEEKDSGDSFPIRILSKELTSKETPLVFLSDKNISLNDQNIKYLLGQINIFHKNYNNTLILQEGFKKYDGTFWTKDYDNLFQLYALALGSGYFRDFAQLTRGAKKGSVVTMTATIQPTLSPKDPNFPAWWEEHKSEWEEPKKEGKEPSDD